jgi:hypothetical protein
MVLTWFFNLPVPEPATIDFSKLPANTVFMEVTSPSQGPISTPPGTNIDELVQYHKGDSYVSFDFFRRDPANPGVLVLKEAEYRHPSDLWSKSGIVKIGRFSLDNKIFTAYPQKSYEDVWVAGGVFAFAEFFCMAIGSFFVRRRKDGTVPEPCSA